MLPPLALEDVVVTGLVHLHEGDEAVDLLDLPGEDGGAHQGVVLGRTELAGAQGALQARLFVGYEVLDGRGGIAHQLHHGVTRGQELLDADAGKLEGGVGDLVVLQTVHDETRHDDDLLEVSSGRNRTSRDEHCKGGGSICSTARSNLPAS